MVELKPGWFKLVLFSFSLFCQVNLDENVERPITADRLLPILNRDFDDRNRRRVTFNGPRRSLA